MRRSTGPTFLLGAHQATKPDAPDLKTSFNKSLAGGAGGDERLNAILLTGDPDISTIADNNSNSEITTLHSPQLQVVPTYNGLPMTSNYVFAIALAVMVLGAEKGPQQACTGIRDDSFDMIPIFDMQRQSLLKYHSLIKAMRVLTRWMVANNRFGEVDVELWRDGVVIGIGRLKKISTEVAGL